MPFRTFKHRCFCDPLAVSPMADSPGMLNLPENSAFVERRRREKRPTVKEYPPG